MKHDKHTKPLAQLLPDETGASAKLIRRTVKIGCAVNILLMILKLGVGYFGHSDALFADGFHSLNDVAADLIMLVFVGISYREADARYAYGYGKFETFSSFLMSAFLIAVSVMIGIEGVESIIGYAHGEVLERPDVWTLVVVLFSMLCKEGLYRFYSRCGRRAESKALVANAWHHRSDALASVATLIGVTMSIFFGEQFRIFDPIASIFIALFILVPAIRMIRPAFAELMEKSLPAEESGKARKAIESVPGVKGIYSLRTRRNGHTLLFDVGIEVSPALTIAQGAEISAAIGASLKRAFCPHILLSVTTRPSRNPS